MTTDEHRSVVKVLGQLDAIIDPRPEGEYTGDSLVDRWEREWRETGKVPDLDER